MGIHDVERSFELRGPSGLGGSPRPNLIGGVLSGLQDTLIDSVRMADKTVIASSEIKRREDDPKARYQENSVYDGLIRELYGKFHRLADEFHICITACDEYLSWRQLGLVRCQKSGIGAETRA